MPSTCLRASFPGGSITGAPKVRAMEIIAELEPSERGVYCGSIGYWSVTGALDTSIAIRTAVALDGRVYFSAGGGIVADSDPEQEYRETLDKARGMIDALVGATAMILLIDNYDSFVHNLARYVRELGGDAVVRRNDAVTLGRDRGAGAEPHHHFARPVLTRGGGNLDRPRPPLRPDDPDPRRVPRPSVHRRGVRRRRSSAPAVRGTAGHRLSRTTDRASSRACRRRFAWPAITRWSSRAPLCPPSLRVIATSNDDGEIMAVEHREHPVVGVQFHPESAATEYGYAMLDRFLHGDARAHGRASDRRRRRRKRASQGR